MLGRVLSLAGALFCASIASLGASECPVPPSAPQPPSGIADWHGIYVKPFTALNGSKEGPPQGMEQIAPQVTRLAAYHHNALRNSLFFESLARQIAERYARSPDFRGLDTAAAERLYRRESGADLDFSLMCLDTRRDRAADDTYGVTLFGVVKDECDHVSLRGLVFTEALINGAVNGACRPDFVYYRSFVIPVPAGTNTITFLCRKDVGGCTRQ